MIEKKVEKAIEEFNKYRSPESTAKLMDFEGKSFHVEFTGVFCQTCGFYDYFEDLRIMLEEAGLKTRIGKVEEMERGATVEFEVKS